MTKSLENLCNLIIEYSFLALFFFVPLVFTSTTSELFELNKILIVYILALIIAASWITNMILTKQFRIQKTPLDIPIMLFLLSQILSTIFSMDPRVSWFGYYSRFNGGLLSTITYIFLYYALATHYTSEYVASQTKKAKSTPYHFGKKLLFFAGAVLIVIIGFLLAAPPINHPEEAQSGVFWTSVVISFFLFVEALPYGFSKRLLSINLLTAAFVGLWAFPSHFGHDPTCYLFRGAFNVACWTDAFQPKVRIFATIGQPAWLGAYFAALLPIALALALNNLASWKNKLFKTSVYSLITILLFIDILFTRTRATFLGLGAGLFVFFLGFLLFTNGKLLGKIKLIILPSIVFTVIVFFMGFPYISFIDRFTYPTLVTYFSASKTTAGQQPQKTSEAEPVKGPALETGGTESGTIRLYVWQGAIDAWKHNLLLGTGVETFGFAYYLYKPLGHNLTSEWDYLYNKTHNEYLNYLATTGAFGLGSYLLIIGTFLFICLKYLINSSLQTRNSKQYQNSNNQSTKSLEHSDLEHLNLFRISDFDFRILAIGLIAGYTAILVTNFFGFSVVLTNLLLFLFPLFIFFNFQLLLPEKAILFPNSPDISKKTISTAQILLLLVVWTTTLYVTYSLYIFWLSDQAYALGYNYDRVRAYDTALPNIQKAVELNPDEPVFKDELSGNNGILAVSLALQKQATSASEFARKAITTSDEVIQNHPNNVIFWKSRVRLFSSLGQLNPSFYQTALEAAQKAQALAPTDPKISYSLGVLYLQTEETNKAIETFKQTAGLKPNYRDAWYALGLSYHTKAIDKKGKVIDTEAQRLAVETMKYLLSNIAPGDTQTKEALKEWGEPVQ